MHKIIPDRPPDVLGQWERRHKEPWHERWHRLNGVTPVVEERKRLCNRPINTIGLSAKQVKKPKERIVHLVDSKAVVRINEFRPRAQIPDVCLGALLD